MTAFGWDRANRASLFVALAQHLPWGRSGTRNLRMQVRCGTDAYYFSAEDRWERVLERRSGDTCAISGAERKRHSITSTFIYAMGQSLAF